MASQRSRRRSAPLLAGGLMVCASFFVLPSARADDSLWGKAMNTIGLGGKSSTNQDGANPANANPAQPEQAQPEQAQPKEAESKPTHAKRSHHAKRQPAVPARQAESAPAAQATGPAGNNAAPAAPSGDHPNLLTNWFGWGRHNDAPPAAQAALAPQGKALAPVPTPPPPPAPAPSSGPSMWDNMLGTVGLNTRNPADNIYYADRPKLNVPKDRALPAPEARSAPVGTRPTNPQDLIQPPADYLEKVRGADGNVSGLRPGDKGKDKKFFGLF